VRVNPYTNDHQIDESEEIVMWIALAVFTIAYIAIASEKFPRHWVALLGGGILIYARVLTPYEALSYISWETLGLLAGMFLLISILNEAGFFTWMAMACLRSVNFRPASLFVILIVLAAVMAMFMDSITVMLFLSTLTLQLCRLLSLDPVPLIIAEVCAANTGGAATLVGDPPNVILGATLGFGFGDFAANTGPLAIVGSLVLLVFFYLVNRKSLRAAHLALTPAIIADIESLHSEPVHAHLTRVGLTGFLAAVVLLVFHLPLSQLSGLPITSAVAALVPAGLALIALRAGERRNTVIRVDVESIMFFAGLFVIIGGLEKVHLFEMLAGELVKLASSSHEALVMALHWGPGLLSGIVDNVPLALAMTFVLKDIAKTPGMPALGLMVWSLAMGVDMGGNLTPIGASANVVAYSIVERDHGRVGWKRWLIVAVPPTLLAMVLVSVLLLLKSRVGWY
jgi:Na+/H+ antiporter NhaD/arsenite permease-like protein